MRKFFEVSLNHKKQNVDIKLPLRATKNSAGYDFYCPVDLIIEPNTSEMIWTDIKAQFEEGEVLILVVTSSMGKKGVMIASTLGIIDCDYFENPSNDGNIGVRLFNFSKETYIIKKGDKICQGIFTNFLTVSNEEEIISTRKGGFGSTNK